MKRLHAYLFAVEDMSAAWHAESQGPPVIPFVLLLLTLGLACVVQAGSGLLLHDRKTKCLYTFCANAFHCPAVVAQVICETSGELDFHAVIW